jgi:hypothetical protein
MPDHMNHRPQPAQEFRPGFGVVAVTPETAIIKYYIVLNIIKLKLYIYYNVLYSFNVLNYNIYNILKLKSYCWKFSTGRFWGAGWRR